ncbi:hypothetical protein A2U01_0072161, partial [Trifolium medium]|nr:hypothetical protein [Trifolium medium]
SGLSHELTQVHSCSDTRGRSDKIRPPRPRQHIACSPRHVTLARVSRARSLLDPYSLELIHSPYIVERLTRIGANNRSSHDPRGYPGSRS